MKSIVFAALLIAAFAFFYRSIADIISRLRLSQKDNRTDNLSARLKNVLIIAFGQTKLLRETTGGAIHFLLFWGFNLFAFAVIESFLQGFSPSFTFSFLGIFFAPITLSQDVFGILVLLAVTASLFRRYVIKIERLQVDTSGKLDALFVLGMITLVVVSMFSQNAAHIAKNDFVLGNYEIRPVSAILAKSIYTTRDAADLVFEISWWVHVLAILAFLNYLPKSKHFHIISSIPNVFFSKLPHERHTLKPINLEDESVDWYGADDVQKLTWKQVLDGYACTECGRCTSVCPAANTGKTLSPRKIIIDIKKRSKELSPAFLAGSQESETILKNTLVHNYIEDKELWQCTTCAACVQECPVMIEHVDAIVDMRRHLTLTESDFPAELNPVFRSMEVNGTPWVFNQSERADWAEGLGIKTMAEDADSEYLFWVGCAGSYDTRYKKVSVALSKILQSANVNFRILGTEEKCNGDTARRLGNEYLAQQLMRENIETLNGYSVKKVITACPHCYNSIKNEFPQFGGQYEVYHHTEFIQSLIDSGRLKLTAPEFQEKRTVYHDSCYIGRYNDIYGAPRSILQNVSGAQPMEMERNKSRGFCCGAGGGRMFLEEVEGGRINEERVREALTLHPETIATACPFCMTMMNDGLKAHQKNESTEVRDIAEIVAEKLA